jgi:hypothetical protein
LTVSAPVRELVESSGEFTFDGGRDVELKGLVGTYRLFGLQWEAPSATTSSRVGRADAGWAA